jgi:hypothetical protein
MIDTLPARFHTCIRPNQSMWAPSMGPPANSLSVPRHFQVLTAQFREIPARPTNQFAQLFTIRYQGKDVLLRHCSSRAI